MRNGRHHIVAILAVTWQEEIHHGVPTESPVRLESTNWRPFECPMFLHRVAANCSTQTEALHLRDELSSSVPSDLGALTCVSTILGHNNKNPLKAPLLSRRRQESRQIAGLLERFSLRNVCKACVRGSQPAMAASAGCAESHPVNAAKKPRRKQRHRTKT